jgi:hypothetical protein
MAKNTASVQLCRHIHRNENVIQVSAGQAPSKQTIGSQLRTPTPPGRQTWLENFEKCEFNVLTSMEKYKKYFSSMYLEKSKI